jgi:hypothetical protein
MVFTGFLFYGGLCEETHGGSRGLWLLFFYEFGVFRAIADEIESWRH